MRGGIEQPDSEQVQVDHRGAQCRPTAALQPWTRSRRSPPEPHRSDTARRPQQHRLRRRRAASARHGCTTDTSPLVVARAPAACRLTPSRARGELGTVVLYQWPEVGSIGETMARRCRARGFSHVGRVLVTRSATAVVVRHLVLAASQFLLPQPRVVGGRALPPLDHTAHNAAHPPAASSSASCFCSRPRPKKRLGPPAPAPGLAGPGTLKKGFGATDVGGSAAAHSTRQCEDVGAGARAGGRSEGTVPPWAQLTDVGPRQHPVAHLKHRVDPARIELRLPFRVCRSEQLPHRRPRLPHPLRAVRRKLAGGVAVLRRREREGRRDLRRVR